MFLSFMTSCQDGKKREEGGGGEKEEEEGKKEKKKKLSGLDYFYINIYV